MNVAGTVLQGLCTYIAIIFTMAMVMGNLSAQPLSETEEKEEEQVIQKIGKIVLASNQAEELVTFPEQSPAIADFIRARTSCTDRVAIFLLRGGFRHTILLTSVVATTLAKSRIPMLGIFEGERAWIDKTSVHLFDFPVIVDTTSNNALLSMFFGNSNLQSSSPCWLTVWSCNGQLLFYYNLYQAHIKLDSLARLAASVEHLPPLMRSALRSAPNVAHNSGGGYKKDSVIAAYPQALPTKTIYVSETSTSCLGKVRSMSVSRSKRWYSFFQVGTSVTGLVVYDSKLDKLLNTSIDSVFFRQQSSSVSDSLFFAMVKGNYIQVLQPFGGNFDPCMDSILYIPTSYGMIEKVTVKQLNSTEYDTTITISKSNWIDVYDVARRTVVDHIAHHQEFNIQRFKLTETFQPLHLIPICQPPLFITTIYRRAYPRGYRLSDVLAPNSDPRWNPTTINHEDNAPLWALLDKKTGKCLGFGGQLAINKRMLGVGYLAIPEIGSCENAAVLHELWTDYIWIAPDGIRHRIKSYYNPSLVSPSKQAAYPASQIKIKLLTARSWASVVNVGITDSTFMLLWRLKEYGTADEQSTIPMIWQLYDRDNGTLLGEWRVPVIYQGMWAVATCFDSDGDLHVLYQDYRRSVIQQFSHHQPEK